MEQLERRHVSSVAQQSGVKRNGDPLVRLSECRQRAAPQPLNTAFRGGTAGDAVLPTRPGPSMVAGVDPSLRSSVVGCLAKALAGNHNLPSGMEDLVGPECVDAGCGVAASGKGGRGPP